MLSYELDKNVPFNNKSKYESERLPKSGRF